MVGDPRNRKREAVGSVEVKHRLHFLFEEDDLEEKRGGKEKWRTIGWNLLLIIIRKGMALDLSLSFSFYGYLSLSLHLIKKRGLDKVEMLHCIFPCVLSYFMDPVYQVSTFLAFQLLPLSFCKIKIKWLTMLLIFLLCMYMYIYEYY